MYIGFFRLKMTFNLFQKQRDGTDRVYLRDWCLTYKTLSLLLNSFFRCNFCVYLKSSTSILNDKLKYFNEDFRCLHHAIFSAIYKFKTIKKFRFHRNESTIKLWHDYNHNLYKNEMNTTATAITSKRKKIVIIVETRGRNIK